MPLAAVKANDVFVVFATKLRSELGEGNPVFLLGVKLCLFNLADKTRLHDHTPF